MRGGVAVGIGMLCLVLVGGCETKTPQRTALLLLKTQDNPFFQDVEAGVKATWDSAGTPIVLDVRAGTTEGDIETQRRVLNEYVSRFAGNGRSRALVGVMMTPSGSGDELTRYIRSLNDKGIPVAVIDTRIASSALERAQARVDLFVGSSNREGGWKAAVAVASRLPKGGDVLLLNGVEGHETAQQRRDGFLAGMDSVGRGPGPRFSITERTCNWRRTEARSVVAALVAGGRRFAGIFAANDEMALGAAEALRQSTQRGRGVVVVGFDATKEAQDAVHARTLTATIAQDPKGMGRVAAWAILARLAKEDVPTEIIMPVKVIDK